MLPSPRRAIGSAALAIALVAALPSSAGAQPGVAAPPTVKAAAYVLADATTGAVLAAKDPHHRLSPASTLKTLTALTLLPRLDPASYYRAVYADAAVEGSKVGILPDRNYTIDQLWRALFLRSGNDAANALSNAAGGVPQTVAMMQAEALRLHATDTTVVNPSGLDEPTQLSSAYDLVLIARAGLQREDFRRYCSLRRSTFPGRKGKPWFVIDNQNALLRNYPGAIGVKTGFTTQARHTLVGAATRGSRTLIVTLMKVPHPYVSKEAAALLDWGFANAETISPVGVLADPGAAPASPGSPGEVLAAPAPNAPPPPDPLGRRADAAALGALSSAALICLVLATWCLRRRRRTTG